MDYGPCTVRDLKIGSTKYWCACGLSKRQPWCDVNNDQKIFQICACKYTKDPPFCDATHTNLPCQVMERQDKCQNKDKHCQDTKLCTGCGWIPDF
ncbi:hypothetical protein KUTeg_021768 [Tegillarca granosa]|uniref:Uncharacterized protein n=1 Tax=Tegillarca granosa TaxID=220873 RepID=A0ABQ9E4J7_TEGGR|nr:hypothetical protein KUTeg_021768 [Tegillarca granosa]